MKSSIVALNFLMFLIIDNINEQTVHIKYVCICVYVDMFVCDCNRSWTSKTQGL